MVKGKGWDDDKPSQRCPLQDALIYKAHFAGSNMGLSNRKGVDTSATYVFTKSTLGLLKKQPAYVAMVTAGEAESNESATTFRHHMYSAYKANRQYNPNVERSKIECLQAASRMGIASISPEEVYPPIEGNGLEADDVIGVLAHRAEERGMRVSIVSPDKDFFQLLSPLVQLIRPTGRHGFEVFTEDNFRREYGAEAALSPHRSSLQGAMIRPHFIRNASRA